MSAPPQVPGFIDALSDVVGREQVLTDPELRAGFEVDWTGRYRGVATAVVRPGDTAEVADVLRCCGEFGASVITQGGNTGLVGGSVPAPDGPRPQIVLSTRRLDHLTPVDISAMQVTAGAGVTLAQWRDHARRSGLDAPVDFAARDSATIGGAIATNAGGSRVVRFGTMRQQVAGIQAVLSDGSVIGSLTGLPKETVGVHLASLLAGSEGTLAVITAARLRLVPWYRSHITAMVAVGDLDDAVAVLARVRHDVPSLDAVEVVLPAAMALVADHLGVTPPLSGDGIGAYVIIDCAAGYDPSAELGAAIGAAPEVIDAAVTTEGPARDHLLMFRDRITEAINAAGIPFKLDVAVGVDRLTELMVSAEAAVARHGGRLIPFGHLAEGNLHLNILEPGDTAAIADEVLGAVAALGGTISAEHGIGIAKTRWLPLVRTPAELEMMTAIRRSVDPHQMMNPRVLAGS